LTAEFFERFSEKTGFPGGKPNYSMKRDNIILLKVSGVLRLVGLAVFLWTLSPVSRADTSPPVAVGAALNAAGISADNVSIVVQGVDDAVPVIFHNASRAMNPASVMKLVTSYAALDLLGPAFVWKTTVLSDAPIVDGVLSGNLYFRGSGDPRLALEQFWLLLRQLRSRGLKEIRGNIVLDRGAYATAPHNPASFDHKPLRTYNVGPNALLVNFQSLTLTLHYDEEEEGVRVFVETPYHDLAIDNRLKAVRGVCGDWREKFKVSAKGSQVTLDGNYPASCGDKLLFLAPWQANEQFMRLFRALWQELGGKWRGAMRVGTPPADAKQIAVHLSPPLSDVLNDLNKYSNNVMARQVFLTLSPRPATTSGAVQRVREWLGRKKIEMPTLVIENGSGLSRNERVSADELRRLLLDVWKSPVMPELVSSLPVAGVDGTLRRRLRDSPAYGRAHLKTGSLEGVRSVAGYVLDARGKRWVLVCIINDPRSGAGGPVIDALVEWVAERAGDALAAPTQNAPSGGETNGVGGNAPAPGAAL
jgi:D-alanyl-D-alanine carboxypeptidase/D-alanyl-D-alanine-endopeptidase (penicillin-binding protein 4)